MTSSALERDFAAAVEPHRASLRLHCYRMLGSSHESDDMVQETLVRAWRARSSLADEARMGAWLHRIATNVCIDELERRPRRALATELSAPADPSAPYAEPLEDAAWLEPMPDAWLAGVESDPDARYALRESVALAFVAALQVLSAPQRATLLLRDVIGLSAAEAAAALDRSVAATESALHRARAVIEEKVGPRDPGSFARPRPEDEAALARYVQAIAASDIDAMIALIHEDLVTTMPPSPTWIGGYEANVTFYRRMFARWEAPGVARVEPIGVNGRPGFAFHRDGELRAIEAVETRDGKILRMHHFMQPAVLGVFRAYPEGR